MQEVKFRYQGSDCYLGIFSTLEQAISARKMARKKLTLAKGMKLSKAEIDANIRSAKEAVSALPEIEKRSAKEALGYFMEGGKSNENERGEEVGPSGKQVSSLQLQCICLIW